MKPAPYSVDGSQWQTAEYQSSAGQYSANLEMGTNDFCHTLDTYTQHMTASPAKLVILPETALPIFYDETGDPGMGMENYAGLIPTVSCSTLFLQRGFQPFHAGGCAGFAQRAGHRRQGWLHQAIKLPRGIEQQQAAAIHA